MGPLNNIQLINRECAGMEFLVVTNISNGLVTIPSDANGALIQVESNVATDKAIRYREDGGVPTAAVGMFIPNAGAFDLTCRKSLLDFKVIQSDAGTTKLNVIYYK